jgi:hypothetical protein
MNPSANLSRNFLYQKYLIDGLTVAEIANIAGYSKGCIETYLRKFNLRKQSQTPQTKEEKRKKRKEIETFRKENGKCVQCEKNPISPVSIRLCILCLGSARIASNSCKKRFLEENRCKDCGKENTTNNNLCMECTKKKTKRDRANTKKIKMNAILKYGTKCVCCDEDNLAFLSIDHIHGRGEEDRAVNGSGISFYQYINSIATDKDKYQILCLNCNCGRARNGGCCPHTDLEIKYTKHWLALKTKVIHHYGLDCYCCNESDIRFLTIDHIEGGGKKHRREIIGSTSQYQWIIDNNYPDYLRTACYNCNWGTYLYDKCPHKI